MELGRTAKDVITGFKGVVVSEAIYLTGCARIGLQASVDNDGKVPVVQWFDEPQLVYVGKKRISPEKKTIKKKAIK